ncbi:uncharacterized protein PHALS_03546 [Plasmopara halstedii]|uniref:Uncharacterized protein n=1 Tax=Plasmopara halstedii TaxID=4781 RepID=A0A0P1AWV6_PLAHL|nr:uncharacterized protein PHALS_03546 [Plasmopara halstedii]CEG46872.1 hypothetical protein PHALS_03546 [Plasmopara halstedii]|eukprot:XP_024583241.1 hypothetical protein PHALS_03546 [Plasmopara halstedii]
MKLVLYFIQLSPDTASASKIIARRISQSVIRVYRMSFYVADTALESRADTLTH